MTPSERQATVARVKQASAETQTRASRAGGFASGAARAAKPKLVAYEHHATVVTALDAADEQLAIRDAELHAARADIATLTALVRKIGGYMSPEQQQAVWAAEARLADAGRKAR